MDRHKFVDVRRIVDYIDYDDYTNKQLLYLPVGLFLGSIGVLLLLTVVFGSPVVLGIEFGGGTEIRLSPDTVEGDPQTVIENEFSHPPDSIQEISATDTYVLTYRGTDVDISGIESDAQAEGFTISSSSQISPSFGSNAQTTALQGLVVAFLGMATIVFLLFKELIPSLTVLASAASDMLVPLGVIGVLRIELTLGTVAALLLLIGYSVDSDILLNNYVFRRGGDFTTSVENAMKIGLNMTLTSFVAMSVMAILGAVLGVQLLRDIGIIIASGLIVDAINTYCLNVSLLRWYTHEYIGDNS